jgi:hypothetical protein
MWSKSKQRYLGMLAPISLFAGAPSRVVPQLVQSRWDVKIGADGRPQEVEVADTMVINGAQVPIRSTVAVSLRLKEDGYSVGPASEWTALADSSQAVAASAPIGAGASVQALDDARIGRHTFEEIVADLESSTRRHPGEGVSSSQTAEGAHDATERTTKQSERFMALAAIFRRRPDSIGKALARIVALSPAAEVLIDALGSASSEQSLEALIELANKLNVSQPVRQRAKAALARSSRPSDNAITALKAMLSTDPFGTLPLFGLGSFARHLRDQGDHGRASAIGELLIERLSAARSVTETVTVLRAIANSGYAPALPHVTPFFDDARDEVRGAAVRALMSMRDPGADRLIATRMTDDSSAEVRLAAIEAARARASSDVLCGALAAVSRDREPRVRYRGAELMLRWVSERPELRKPLEAIAAADSEPRVRELAKAGLAKIPVSGT